MQLFLQLSISHQQDSIVCRLPSMWLVNTCTGRQGMMGIAFSLINRRGGNLTSHCSQIMQLQCSFCLMHLQCFTELHAKLFTLLCCSWALNTDHGGQLLRCWTACMTCRSRFLTHSLGCQQSLLQNWKSLASCYVASVQHSSSTLLHLFASMACQRRRHLNVVAKPHKDTCDQLLHSTGWTSSLMIVMMITLMRTACMPNTTLCYMAPGGQDRRAHCQQAFSRSTSC